VGGRSVAVVMPARDVGGVEGLWNGIHERICESLIIGMQWYTSYLYLWFVHVFTEEKT